MSSNSTSVPPISPGLAPHARQSSWPTVLGVIGLVFGILGSLSYLCGALVPVVLPLIKDYLPAEATADIPPTPAISIVISCLQLALAVLLCVAATRLLQRRAVTVKLWRTWAWLKIVLGIAAAAVTIPTQIEAMRQAAAEQSTQPSPMTDEFMTLFAVIGGAVGLLFLLALPVFALIWFRRDRIRQEIALWA